LPRQLTGQLLDNIVFPSFSEINRERPRDLFRAVVKVRLALIGLIIPIYFLLSFVAQPLIDFLYDERYTGAGPLLALMALNGALGTFSMPYQNLMLAQGRSDRHALFTFIWASLVILGMLAGFFGFGLIGLFVGVGVGTVFTFCGVFFVAYRQGYATIALDFFGLAGVIAFYAYTLASLDPAALPMLGSS
jgi:O-antigen/teichoic acid export membrane protein